MSSATNNPTAWKIVGLLAFLAFVVVPLAWAFATDEPRHEIAR